MIDRGRIARRLVVVLTGGVLLQAVGCATGFLPVLLSLAESTVLGILFGGFGV